MHIRQLILPILAGCLVLGAASSCKKKEADKPQKIDDVIYPSYSHLDSGNYWIYGYYTTDSLGNVIGLAGSDYDSCYVEKDTIIRDATWHKYVSYSFPARTSEISFLRDSLQYIVAPGGNILFASLDFSTVFFHRFFLDRDHNFSTKDTLALVEMKMADRDKGITVPAGNFITSSMRTTWTFNDSLDRMQYPSPRRQDTRYSTTVGKVSETLPFYISIPTYTERRLLRYRLR